ncbi:glycosyltransferase family 2 protein [Yersinia proxima]|uniref:glycosyltransferase family 2 protein n=1 Tax=Yersinia proxima TaxID=2890316 RepID=UPI0031192584|nr:glycosyltransferase family 2 protein [Citrobacter amalonaticus]
MKSNKISVDIVLATYNGEEYISEQIRSILDMDGFNDVINQVIICDDNSKDRTLNIVKELIPSEKLTILTNDRGENYGPVKNFERGILSSTAEMVMLSDQDDYWEHNKLTAYLSKVSQLDRERPFLIFSDLKVVDSTLNTLSNSFLQYQSIPCDWFKNIDNLLIQNVAPGCTMLFNRKLISHALPLPENCVMHDWWLLLVAKATGDVEFIPDTYIKYRQHQRNQVGAKKNGLMNILWDFEKNKNKAKRNLFKTIKQMNSFKLNFHDVLSRSTNKKIDVWNACFLQRTNPLKKIYLLMSCNLKKSSFNKTLGLYYLVMTTKGEK